ncbi:replication endonuclease [Shewanella psychrotolerans]|uniref:replication endonuclease n=1 Tax=Shewanella psychrotolerans TaxID=2864206 RepID=UPI001C65F99B|nr:replication endonuclease [Shewanella psychrotolerans]QYK02427.1 replication endonuclease [Shewanella psychrotolerans]
MDLQQIERQAGINFSAIFSAPHQQADLKWSQKQLDGLPDDIAASLFKEYVRKHRAHGRGRSANIWLRNRIKSTRAMLRQFPLPLWHINTEVRRAAVAKEWADRSASILNNLTYGGKQADAKEMLEAVKQPADQWGFCPVLPSFNKYDEKKASGVFDHDPRMYNTIAAALARLVDDAWWLRKLDKAYRQYKEHAAIVTGKVRAGVSPYVSTHALKEFKNRKAAAKAWLNEMTVVNETHGLEISLADAVAASVANPEVRRAELMVRMRGFEDLAIEQGFIAEFYTWTAPSRYHSYVKSKKGPSYSNKRYQGTNPKDTQAYLCHQWAKTRSKLAREEIEMFGFRVVEPHHDGTPHWHMVLFFRPDQLRHARSIMRKYALQHHKDELAPPKGKRGQRHNSYRSRFDFKTIDPAKGSATGYIAKYVAKNIDGAYVDDDYEAESSGKHGAEGVAAWASTWNIRQFQQIGGPSVTVWRELRRLREAISFDDVIELARNAADSSNWQRYVEAMGGTLCKRVDRPIQLSKVINHEANLYGEDISKIMGVMSCANAVQTRLEGWKIRQPNYQTPQPSADEAAFDVAFDLASKSGDSRAPWSSDNNCTQSIKTNERIANVPLKDRQLIAEANKLGLDCSDLKRLRAGAVVDVVVNDSHTYIRLRDGMLIVSKAMPNDHLNGDWSDTALDSQFDAIQRQRNKMIDQQLREQAWRLLDTKADVENWVSTMDPDIAKRALEQLRQVLDVQNAEQYASAFSYHHKTDDEDHDDEPF